MLISDRFIVIGYVSAVCVGVLAAGPGYALDAKSKSQANAAAPLAIFKDPSSALQRGIETYQKGDVANSIPALKYAADGGKHLARWKLGRMYARGEGVKKNHVAAYNYFARIIRDYKEDQLDPRERSVVASAFVSVGGYSLTGIPKSRVSKNIKRAMRLFHYAATVFGDANAQYNLARMYLDDRGIKRNPRQAVPWLRYAAEKGHVHSLALLGNILFKGERGVARQKALGLMYLTLAREVASVRKEFPWIIELHGKAIVAANEFDKEMAHLELKRYLRRRAHERR